MGRYAAAVILVVLIALAGCSQSQNYENPTELNDTPDNGTQEESGNDLVKTFSVGDKASNGEMAVQLNSVQYVKNLPVTSDYLASKAEAGKKFVLADLTVFNLQKNKSATISNLLTVEIKDGQGYTYEPSFYSASNLERGFSSGQVLPGEERRGRIAVSVPENATNLTLKYRFSVFGSGAAVFELPEKETRYSLQFAEQPEPAASVEIVSVDSSWTEYDSAYLTDSGSITGIEMNIANTGDIAFTPKVGLTITHDGNEVYSGTDVLTFFSAFEPSQSSTEDLAMMQSIEESGEYTFNATVRAEGSTAVLATDTFRKVIE